MATKSKPSKIVLVTGAEGFIGRNLIAHLQQDPNLIIKSLTRQNSFKISEICEDVDFVFHTAGENRPEDPSEFEKTNVELTRTLLKALSSQKKPIPLVFTSSTQANLDNPYGVSKKKAEDLIFEYGNKSLSPVFVFRLPNVFGKWSKPNYNSVVATFCNNLVQGVPLQINDPDYQIHLVHIDEVIRSLTDCMDAQSSPDGEFCQIKDVHDITVGELATLLTQFWEARQTLQTPDLSSSFNKALYGTLTSFYNMADLGVKPIVHSDDRGWLFELVKSKTSGQIFVSSTHPGFTRGDHWHHTKVEKFTVIKGEGTLLFRRVHSDEILKYELSDKEIMIVDVPTGYVHAIHNKGTQDMILLIWASEMLDKENPDTYYEKVEA